MFDGWDNYYVVIGTAAGALIGMLFVVVSLTSGIDPKRMLRGAAIYMTPTLFHFAAVLAVSAFALAPRLPTAAAGAGVLVCAGIGAVYGGLTAIRVMRRGGDEPPHWTDKYFYGLAPALAHLALGIGAVIGFTHPLTAAYGIAAAAFALLLIGVRNAWDLATFIAAYHPQRQQP